MDTPKPLNFDWIKPTPRTKTLAALLALVLVCHLLNSSVLWPVQVLGDSMRPNFDHGTRHYVNKFAYWTARPQRGDVVTLRVREGEMFIKRVIGLPGETVSFKEGRLVINGRLLAEYYTSSTVPSAFEPVKVRENCYFVIGDNRATSVMGAIPADRIVGKVIF